MFYSLIKFINNLLNTVKTCVKSMYNRAKRKKHVNLFIYFKLLKMFLEQWF